MIKILILGGDGMIGHQLFLQFKLKYSTMTTLKLSEKSYVKYNLYNKDNSFFNIDVTNFDSLKLCVELYQPNFIVNAIGITKQRITSNNHDLVIKINSFFPHELGKLCEKMNIKLFQLSTDCVFSGLEGNYTEKDKPDCKDLYGQSKLNGEIINNRNVITIRKSTIGFECNKAHGLLEWFFSQTGEIYGYKNAFFTGITTIELSKVIEAIIKNYSDIYSLWNIGGDSISKFDLLNKIRELSNKNDINILEDNIFLCDRSLDSSKFINYTKYNMPSWSEMLQNLSNDYSFQKIKIKNNV